MPNCGKDGAQQKTQRQLFEKTPDKQSGGVAQPEVAPTQGEAVIEPYREKESQEQKTGKVGMLAAKRAQKPVPKPQSYSQQAPGQKAIEVGGGRVH